jgi:hypothetical protein
MPEYRKPPLTQRSRPDTSTLPSDSGGFSIESTTMRLKSMRLRRAEVEKEQAANVSSDTREETAKAPPASTRPSGRVRHDERGMAVWDWAVATGEFATLSATRAMKKLQVADLQIDDAPKTPGLSLEKAGRDEGGGFDPYNQRGSGRREGEAAQRQGVTGAKDRDRSAALDRLYGKVK